MIGRWRGTSSRASTRSTGVTSKRKRKLVAMSASVRSTARSESASVRDGHVGAGHRKSSMSAGTTAASAPRSSSRWRSSSSPVHSSMNTFLNSIASAHPLSPETPVDPTTELASAEANVLPNVESATTDLLGRESFDEPVDDAAPTRSVERTGTDVDLGVRRRPAPAAHRRRRAGGCRNAGRARRTVRARRARPAGDRARSRSRRRARGNVRPPRRAASRATARGPTRPRASGTPLHRASG